MIQISDFGPQEKQQLRDTMTDAAKNSDCPNCCMVEEFEELRMEAPNFLADRIESFSEVVTMSQDPDWDLPILDRKRTFNAGKYLQQLRSGDLTPVESAVLGAYALDLVANDMQEELNLYREFQQYRASLEGESVSRMEWLRHKRETERAKQKSFFGFRRSNIKRATLATT